jgi:hypothetical protein
MGNILLAFLILVGFAVSGYWLYVLLGRPGRTVLECFVVSAWAGLLAILLVLINLYCLSNNIPAHFFAFPIVSVFSLASFVTYLSFRKRLQRLCITRSSISVVLISLIAVVFISSPFLEKKDLSFYYTNNGEYLYYALESDVVQFHGSDPVVPQMVGSPTTQSREVIVGLLGALFATITGKSSFFIIQPLSYAFAWLAFLSLGIILLRLGVGNKTSYWLWSVIFVTYMAALFSAANQQFWTMSFMSQYINQDIVFGLIFFLIASKANFRALNGDIAIVKKSIINMDGNEQLSIYKPKHPPVFFSREIFLLGLVFAASGCAYPEQLVTTVVVVSFIYIFLSPHFLFRTLYRRVGVLLIAGVIALILGNFFLLKMISGFMSFYASAAFSHASAGWNIYGPTSKWAWLIGNLFGLSNIFYAVPCITFLSKTTPCSTLWWHMMPTSVPFFCFIFIFLMGVARAVYLFTSAEWNNAKILQGVFIGYFLVAVFALWWLHYQNASNNYMAVKFIITWIWVVYIALAYAFGTLRSFISRCIITILGMVIFISVLVQGYGYSSGMRIDAQQSRYVESDMKSVRQLTGKQPPIIISTQKLDVFNIIGYFLVLEKNIWPMLTTINTHINVNEGVKKEKYRKQVFFLVFGPDHLKWLQTEHLSNTFEPVYNGDALTLFRRKI